MLNRDGTINFDYFSKKSKIQRSSYQNQKRQEPDNNLENLLTNQNIEPEVKQKLNYYYGKKSQRENSIRGTITKQAKLDHVGSGNIVSRFIMKGNANKLLAGRETNGRPVSHMGFKPAKRRANAQQDKSYNLYKSNQNTLHTYIYTLNRYIVT